MVNLRTRLKSLKRGKANDKVDLHKLKNETIRSAATSKLNAQLNKVKADARHISSIDKNRVKNVLRETKNDCLKLGHETKKKNWTTQDILQLMENRRREERGKNKQGHHERKQNSEEIVDSKAMRGNRRTQVQ